MTAECNENAKNVMRDPAKRDDVKEILAQIGAQPKCEQGEFGGKTEIFGGLASAGFGGSYSVGCEQVSAIVDAFYSTRKNIACRVSKRAQRADTSLGIGQKITLINGPGGRLDCPQGVRLSNVAKGDLVITQSLTASDIRDIKNDIKETVKTTIDNFQKSEKEFASTPQGQKSYQAAIQSVDEHLESTTVDTQINEIVANANVNHEIRVENLGLITGKDCLFSNEAVVSLVANNIIDSVAKETFSNQSVMDFLSELKNKQENKASGLFKTSTVGMIIGLILLVVVAYFVYQYYSRKTSVL